MRFNSTAGLLAAATLLSGSAFAFAPEFNNEQFPTVIITDRTTGPAPSAFDDPAAGPSTSYTFQFPGALDLGNFIDPSGYGNAAVLSDIKVVFNEFDDTADLTPNSVKTLSINGVEALTSLPVKADFAGANAFDAGVLDFRNIDLSPVGGAPYDNLGVSGHNIDNGPQSRIVSISIDTVDSTTPASNDTASFEVITQKSADDTDFDRTEASSGQPTGPTDIFTAVVADPGNFNGWGIGFTDNAIFNILNGPSNGAGNPASSSTGVAGFQPVPVVTITDGATGGSAPANTATISLASTSAQIGLCSWTLPQAAGPTLTPGNIYRLELDITSLPATNGADLFLRFGDVFKHGQATTAFSADNTFIPNGTVRQLPKLGGSVTGPVSIYVAPKASGQTSLEVAIIDSSNTGAQEFTLNGYSVDVATRAAVMAGSSVVLNRGGSVPALAAGETIAAPAGETGIISPATTPTTPLTDTTVNSTGLNNQMPSSVTVSGNKVLFQTGASPAATHWEFTDFGFFTANPLSVDTMNSGIALNPSKLYLMDIYASTNSPTGAHPTLVASVGLDISLTNHTSWWVSTALGDANVALAAAPKVYTAMVNPSTSPNAEARATINLRMLHTVDIAITNTTITVHRIVLYETGYEIQ